jgi:hypothetical protein
MNKWTPKAKPDIFIWQEPEVSPLHFKIRADPRWLLPMRNHCQLAAAE